MNLKDSKAESNGREAIKNKQKNNPENKSPL